MENKKLSLYEEKMREVNDYFKKSVRIVYIDRCNLVQGIESFEKYLDYRYKDNCYFYSLYALMGLNSDDFLVRGDIDGDYQHGWVEFEYKNSEYVFDSMTIGIVSKNSWYKEHKPMVMFRRTQKAILDEYLDPFYAIKISEGFYQIRGMDCILGENPTLEDYRRLDNFLKDPKKGYIFNALNLSRIEIDKFSGRIKGFIAHTEPSG